MPTTRPQAEHKVYIGNWEILELENDRGLEFLCPNGYVFGFSTIEAAFDLIAAASYGGTLNDTMYGDKHYVGPDGIIEIRDADAWINKGWNYGAAVCHRAELTDIILRYALKVING